MINSILVENLSTDQLFSRIEEIVSQAITKRLLPVDPPIYNTIKEVGARLRCSRPTIRRLTDDGFLKKYKIGRHVLYKADEIDLAIREISNHKYKRN